MPSNTTSSYRKPKDNERFIYFMNKSSLVLFTPKKTEHNVKIVKIVNVFKKIWTITILIRKDVPTPGKLVWGPYD